MIEALKPYRVKGNALLYAVHAFDSPDKRRRGLVRSICISLAAWTRSEFTIRAA
jgi:hypothetical protein